MVCGGLVTSSEENMEMEVAACVGFTPEERIGTGDGVAPAPICLCIIRYYHLTICMLTHSSLGPDAHWISHTCRKGWGGLWHERWFTTKLIDQIIPNRVRRVQTGYGVAGCCST